MSSTSIGRQAEDIAIKWLISRGWKVVDRNWRTRWCEIDIVARHGQVLHFVEVKYRRNEHYGGGLSSISREKCRRLQRAALAWLQSRAATDWPYQIDVLVLSGFPKPRKLVFLPNCVTVDTV